MSPNLKAAPKPVPIITRMKKGNASVPTMRLFEKLGLRPVRYHWFMVRDLDEEPPAPVWPEGICLETFQDRPDLKAAARATDDAFKDHWGYVPKADEEAWLERVRHAIETDEAFDPTLWFLAMDGDEVVGTGAIIPERKEIGAVYIEPERQKERIGTKIMKKLEQRALKKYGLDFVDVCMPPDEGIAFFYDSLGYRKKGCLYVPVYGMRILLHVMRKHLNE